MALAGPTLPRLHQCLVLWHYIMAATNKKRQPADYFIEGLGLSMELGLEQCLHVVAAIIPITAYVPRGLCWPAPARPLLQGHFGKQLSPLPGPARARQLMRVFVATTQIILLLNSCCHYSWRWRLWPRQCSPLCTGQQSAPC